ncbi:uncharacterized protein LOC127103533 [Lathyrus oleraceus]|uniref:uncharacterized protein LOC127103533 n=1 Tax=Pisum sativum TaxID=3888 RepID=UPI0021D00D2B|nr:uncharacterized protein LOC127103533 [Pisum sativum]
MTVVAYAEKFEDMTAYSRQAEYAPDEKWEIDQFLFGLRGEISRSVSQREFTTYDELIRKCYVVEKSLKKCIKHLDLQVIPLSPPMVVTTAMDDVVEISLICENCSLSVNGRILHIDLICLPLKRVDVVLGMDWISAYSVFIGCEEKLIIIPSSETTPKDVLTTILEGTIGMVIFLFKKEKSVLLVLTKEPSDNLKVTQIPIIFEFPEVFPEDVTSLPPEREVEFSIDLIPGTAPISISPYRMAPLELRELKDQLEELLTKHFI